MIPTYKFYFVPRGSYDRPVKQACIIGRIFTREYLFKKNDNKKLALIMLQTAN